MRLFPTLLSLTFALVTVACGKNGSQAETAPEKVATASYEGDHHANAATADPKAAGDHHMGGGDHHMAKGEHNMAGHAAPDGDHDPMAEHDQEIAAAHPHAPDGATVNMTDAYEAVRKALAGDDLVAARAAGTALAKSASAHDSATAAAAAKLADAQDLDTLRLAFGATSEAYIAMLVKMPGMATGLHAFSCPMAKGYKKWVQKSDTIDNPYMGKRMPGCGTPTDLVP